MRFSAPTGPGPCGGLAGKAAGGDHVSDRLGEDLVADLGLRTGPAPQVVFSGAPVIDGGPWCPGDSTHLGQGDLHLLAHPGRFCGGIWSPLFSATFFQTSFSRVSSPIFRLASRSLRSSSVVPRLPFRPSLPASRKSSRQAARRWASTPSPDSPPRALRPGGVGVPRPASCSLTTDCSTGSQPFPRRSPS